MQKTVKISLGSIVEQIDKATRDLGEARKKAAFAVDRKVLNLTIRNLNAIRKVVAANCRPGSHSLAVLVPVGSASKRKRSR